MSITPNGLTATLRRAALARTTVTEVTETIHHGSDSKNVSFYVEDNQGGMLKVTVCQYKEPIR